MYLLKRGGQGQLQLERFDGIKPPPYAILSHTWGLDLEELSFEDVRNGTGQVKTGYKKAKFCLDKAEADGLQYCWIDTCCIDKANHSELSEAIISMHRWYQNAVKCYVYLSDVPENQFRSSRWFSRGWTLQELLAPSTVEFFSSDGERLGDKKSLLHVIHERTQIPKTALQGQNLASFSIEEKWSWMEQRQTTKEEDKVYSLLGIFDVSMPVLYGETYIKAKARLDKEIQESLTSAGQGLSRSVPSSEGFLLPFGLSGAPLISSFIGRRHEITQIEQGLPTGNTRETVVLHGLGGVGKTQLAIEYAKKHRDDYTAILWLDGRDEVSLQQSFARAAKRLCNTNPSLTSLKSAVESDDIVQTSGAVQRWLDSPGNSRWLLIIDNVDDPYIPGVIDGLYDLRSYLPTTLHGHILITTRSSLLRIGKQVLVRKLLDDKDCMEILRSSSQRQAINNEPKVLNLIKRLDGLPLALSAAGAYLNQVPISIAEFLDQYEHSWLELQQYSPSLLEHEGRTLQTTWEISRQQIKRRSVEACRLLELWAFFASQDVWYELLQAGRDKAPEWFRAITKSKIEFAYHMRLLCDYGLVEAHKEPVGYGMHSCVHDWVREVLGKDDEEKNARLALRCIARAVPDENELEYRMTQQRLLVHAENYQKYYYTTKYQAEEADLYVDRLGSLYRDQGKLAEAEAIYQQVLVDKEKALGTHHTSTLQTVNNLGVLYVDQGKLAEAEAMYQRALAGKEKALGSDHVSTLQTVNNLGILYCDQGKFAEAEAMYQRALAGKENVFGSHHTSTLDTVYNLGNLYYDQGKPAEAEVMYQRALEGTEKVLGSDHVSTLQAVNNLGVLYCDQGKLAEAEAMYKRALAGKEKALGSEHTSTIDTLNNLGCLYKDQGKLAEAQTMYQRALAGKEKALGTEHMSTLDTVNALVNIYWDQGKLAEAKVMYRRALAGYQKVLGVDHNYTREAAESPRRLDRRSTQTESMDTEAVHQERPGTKQAETSETRESPTTRHKRQRRS